MTTNQIPQETIIKVSNELSELVYRARKVGYKNIPPRLPKRPTTSTMSGFYKRFRNWSSALKTLEFETNRQTKHTITANANLLENYTRK